MVFLNNIKNNAKGGIYLNRYLKQKRLKADLSISEAAAALGISEDTIKSWENGSKKPNIDDLRAIGLTYRINKRQLSAEIRKQLNKETKDTFGIQLAKKKNELPDDFDLDCYDLDLNKNDISILSAIKIANLCGTSPLRYLYKIISDPILLDKALTKLLGYKLIEFDEPKGFCCITKLGAVVMEIIRENNLYRGIHSSKDLCNEAIEEIEEEEEEREPCKGESPNAADIDLAEFLK